MGGARLYGHFQGRIHDPFHPLSTVPLLALKNVSIAYGDNQLLDHASLTLDSGQRVGLIGRNGEGKSTLLNIISGRQIPDEGEIRIEPGATIANLEQEPNLSGKDTIYDTVAMGLGEIGVWLAEYHRVIEDKSMPPQRQMEQMGRLQQKLDAQDGWRLQQRVEKTLSRLGLPADVAVQSLSGGWQRRVSLARALVREPRILLLDEPTNHLDIESILWLEEQIIQFSGTVLFVTHDRRFLKKVANQIVDLDRGKLVSWMGSYGDYQRRKADALIQEARQQAEFDRKLAAEESWIRQGIQARRTRNEGRVRALKKMRVHRAERQNQKGKVKLQLDRAESSGKVIIEATKVSFQYGDNNIVKDFSIRILRGDRIGIIGPNGIGKTTLIKLLLGNIEPDSGSIRHGSKLETAWFDQLRSQVDLNATVVDAIGEGRDQITINGKEKHVISYLSDFLFTPSRARSPVRSLSGGERARVLLAKLFSKPTNLLVMDEPTNDLDIETLELLEEMLLDFKGTLILVSHDREFMDNVVTSTLALEGNGVVREYVGGYSDWERQRPVSDNETVARSPQLNEVASVPITPTKRKLGYRQQQELSVLPEKIDALEQRQARLTGIISKSDFYQQDGGEIEATISELDQISAELDDCYHRWSELEA